MYCLTCVNVSIGVDVCISQDELAAVQARLSVTEATAADKLQNMCDELDRMKNKLLSERTANKRQMELSAEVIKALSTNWACMQGYAF